MRDWCITFNNIYGDRVVVQSKDLPEPYRSTKKESVFLELLKSKEKLTDAIGPYQLYTTVLTNRYEQQVGYAGKMNKSLARSVRIALDEPIELNTLGKFKNNYDGTYRIGYIVGYMNFANEISIVLLSEKELHELGDSVESLPEYTLVTDVIYCGPKVKTDVS